MYVLDTNTLIYYFKGQGQVAKHLAKVPTPEIHIPTVVLFELQVGITKSNSPAKRTQQLQQILSRVNLVPFDRPAALAAATIRAQLEQQGTPIGAMDVLIAGTAMSLQATLVTHNVKRVFSRGRAGDHRLVLTTAPPAPHDSEDHHSPAIRSALPPPKSVPAPGHGATPRLQQSPPNSPP
jgi:tRNA(fMet)-specific endonuclease VapC